MSSKILAAVTAAALGFTSAAHAAVLFSSNGFENYNLGTLVGQGGFVRDSGADSQWTVQSTVALGTKAVAATGAATTWAYPAVNYTPAANELVVVGTSIAASDPTLSAIDPFGYLVDMYSTDGLRFARFGLAYNNNTIIAVVTSKFNSTTGQFDPTGTATNVIVATALTANTFYDFSAELNFATQTWTLKSGANALATNIPFVAAATGLGDADLQISGATSATATGYFDNYLIQTVVPEPTALAALSPAALLIARRRR